ncbi:MAG: hypothetical protein QW212_03890 [Nitrososphaerales archaeon]
MQCLISITVKQNVVLQFQNLLLRKGDYTVRNSSKSKSSIGKGECRRNDWQTKHMEL